MEKFNLSNEIDDREYKPVERNLIQKAVKELKERIDKLVLCGEASIQDYLVAAQDEVNSVFGDKITQ